MSDKTQVRRAGTGILLRTLVVVCVLIALGCAVYLLHYVLQTRNESAFCADAAQQYIIQPSDLPRDDYTEQTDTDFCETDIYAELPVTIAEIDFSALQEISPNVCAWIRVNGIEQIDYPVVWCGDDSYYLTHGWDGSERSCGAIFLEGECKSNLSDAYLVIYGHYMRAGTMFGALEQYAEADFCQQNGGYITLYLPEETRIYQIYSARYVSPADESAFCVGFAHDSVFADYIKVQQENSLYDTGVTVSSDDQVLTLSTCANSGRNRFVVHAVLKYTVPSQRK